MGEGGDDGREFGVGREGHDENFGRRNTGREREDSTFGGVGACPVDVFDEGIQDAADPEGGLDNVGSVFPYYKSYIISVSFQTQHKNGVNHYRSVSSTSFR